MAQYKLRCPDCLGKFISKTISPDRCPLCNFIIPQDDDDGVVEIKAPFIRSARTDSIDKVYTDIEKSSEVRMEKAAEMAGNGTSASDMSGLKITDLRTNIGVGDIYAPELPPNPVTQQMEALNKRGGHFGFAGSNGAEFSGAVATGPVPNAGAKVRTMIQQRHGEISGGTAVSDLPALETMQPGYRRRG